MGSGRDAALLAVVALAATLAVPFPATAQDPTAIVDVHPLPGAVVEVDGAEVRALVVGDERPTGATVRVDGVEVDHTTDDTDRGLEVRADLSGVAAGDRSLAVTATTADGDTTRSWSVTVTATTSERLAGPDRYATAVAVSQDLHPEPGSADAAVLARSDDFADALAGAPLASHLGGPLLLTSPDALPAATAAELDRVLASDAPVHVLGGTIAVSRDVEDAVEAAGHPVVRHAGPDRHATAARIARALGPTDIAFVASATRFPDALAASVPAARDGVPVLLTDTDRLPDATLDVLAELGVHTAVVVGGEVAVGAGVEARLADTVDDVERVAGPTRFATAVAIADRYLADADEVALASGRDYPDALGAATRAASHGAPLLLVEPTSVPTATDDALRRARPDRLAVHGGPVAVSQDVATAARNAVVDGPAAPRVVAADPGSGERTPTIAPVVIDLDRAVDASSLVASASLDGVELPASVRVDDAGTRVVVDPLSPGDRPLEVPREVRVVLRAATPDGDHLHHSHAFVLRDPLLAVVGPLELVAPSAAVEVVGYHQSNHEGARQMAPTDEVAPWHTMSNRGRRSGSRSAADVVADEHVEVVAPVTGRVVRAGTYVLYCDHTDNFVAIEPDGMPGIEVKLLHFRGLRVGPDDRVVAGDTVIGDGPRRLPFGSQVDEYSRSGHGPHVHVEVVDTSIPDVPNGGSGSDDC